jgi:predicted esterase
MVGASGSATAGASVGGAASSGTASGGATTAGSTSTGGATSGGTSAGGTSSSGGASSGGAAGASSGGGGGSGGVSGKGSPGCGSASPLKSGNFTETISGAMRKYVLDVPANYDTNKKYRLIFVWHPLGGSASQVVNGGYNGLKSLSEGSAIFVAADGLNGGNGEASGVGWWNVDNVDMLFLTAMLAKINAGLCVDSDRIFSTGFSFGGMMSYTVGYEFDVFRAIAPCSGDLQVIPHKETYTRPLPIMAFHGDMDDFVTTARGRAARDKYLARNKCGTATMPVSPSPCVEYQGCSVPTFWCEFPGAHAPWSEEPKAIWKFFSQF